MTTATITSVSDIPLQVARRRGHRRGGLIGLAIALLVGVSLGAVVISSTGSGGQPPVSTTALAKSLGLNVGALGLTIQTQVNRLAARVDSRSGGQLAVPTTALAKSLGLNVGGLGLTIQTQVNRLAARVAASASGRQP